MIGKLLKTIRRKSGLSQSEIAKKMNLARSTITHYELELSQPTFEIIEKIANECGYDIVFIERKTKETLSSKNIDREEI